MVKSTISTKLFQFPFLMSKSFCGLDIVVLFSSEKVGTVVKSNNESFPIGYWSEKWDMSYFVPCNSYITLENS